MNTRRGRIRTATVFAENAFVDLHKMAALVEAGVPITEAMVSGIRFNLAAALRTFNKEPDWTTSCDDPPRRSVSCGADVIMAELERERIAGLPTINGDAK